MKIYVICYMCFAGMLTLTYSIKLSQEINPCQEPKKQSIDQFFSQKLVWKILLLIKISYLHMRQDSRISTVKTFLSKFCELGPNFVLFFIGFLGTPSTSTILDQSGESYLEFTQSKNFPAICCLVSIFNHDTNVGHSLIGLAALKNWLLTF